MITNRKIRWFVAFIGILVCTLVWGLVVNAQSANQAYINQSTCTGVGIAWKGVPTNQTPVYSGGSIQLLCPWGSYTWRPPVYILNDGQDYYFSSQPTVWTDIPKAGNNWDQCLIGGYLLYIQGGYQYHKNIEYPPAYDGYLDCQMKELPMIMHYGPRTYQVYDPYPGPMQGKSMNPSKQAASKSGNPYP
jgi:hypothetical protein